MNQSKTPTLHGASVQALVIDDLQAAELIGMSVFTLRKWRTTGHGPAYIKCGKSVKYRLSDLEAYIEKQMVAR